MHNRPLQFTNDAQVTESTCSIRMQITCELRASNAIDVIKQKREFALVPGGAS